MTATSATSASTRPRPLWATILGWVGLVGHLGTGYFYLASGLVAPFYGIVILWALWLVLLGVAIWTLLRRPAWTIAVPVVSLLVLSGGLALGGAILGWQP